MGAFKYFACGDGLNPSTIKINETVFVICANVPGPNDTLLSGGELAGAIVGPIVGFFLLVGLFIWINNKRDKRAFIRAIVQQQMVTRFEHMADGAKAKKMEPSSNVVPLTPEEIAHMKV